MRISTRIVLLAVAFSGALTLAGSAGGGRAETGRRGPAQCSNLQIGVSPITRATGAGGLEEVKYRASHLFGPPCVLNGYPRVELLGARFQPRPALLHHGGGYLHLPFGPSKPVVLSAGRPAYFYLAFVVNLSANSKPCTPAEYILAFLPNEPLPVVAYVVTRSDLPKGEKGIIACGSFLWVTAVLPTDPK